MKTVRKLLVLGAVLGGLAAVAAWPVARAITSGAKEVYLLTPHAAELVQVNKELYDGSKTPKTVMQIYGLPGEEPEKVVFVPEEKLVRPPENPDVVFLPVDKSKGENPLQAKTVEFVAKYAVGGGVLGAVLCLLGLLLVRPAKPVTTSDAGSH